MTFWNEGRMELTLTRDTEVELNSAEKSSSVTLRLTLVILLCLCVCRLVFIRPSVFVRWASLRQTITSIQLSVMQSIQPRQPSLSPFPIATSFFPSLILTHSLPFLLLLLPSPLRRSMTECLLGRSSLDRSVRPSLGRSIVGRGSVDVGRHRHRHRR